MNLRAEVNDDMCISAGKCVADAPSAFRFDADEIAHSIDGATALGEQDLLRIARNCPSGAIQMWDGGNAVTVD